MAKILVVDDIEFIRLKISKMLKADGLDVVQAENGLRAIEVYQSERPDVVLMDITMPEMDGLTALKKIREIDIQANVIMLTALDQESIILETIKSGARDFLPKPFDRERVLNAIHKLVG